MIFEANTDQFKGAGNTLSTGGAGAACQYRLKIDLQYMVHVIPKIILQTHYRATYKTELGGFKVESDSFVAWLDRKDIF